MGRRRFELRWAGLKVRYRAISVYVPKIGTGVEDRTPLIFFVGEAPSPDDNPGIYTWWTEGRLNPRLLGFNQALHRLSYQSEIGG